MEGHELPMFPCHYCSKYNGLTFKRLLRHIKDKHSSEPGFSVSCHIGGCQKIYTNLSSYESHLVRKHGGRDGNIVPSNKIVEADNSLNNNDGEDVSEIDRLGNLEQEHCENEMEIEDDPLLTEEEFAQCLGVRLLKLRETQKQSMKSLRLFLSEMEDIVGLDHEQHSMEIRQLLLKAGFDISCVPGLEEKLNEASKFKTAFGLFKEEWFQSKFFDEHFTFIRPIEYLIGNTGSKKESFQYVPIADTLRALLKQEDVLMHVLNPHSSQDETLQDFCDGTSWKSHPLFSSDSKTLQIQLYCDDFQASNPLGNRIRKYKITAFYFTLGNLPPKYRSKLHVIQLLILCKSHLLKSVENRRQLLAPFITDMNSLSREGIKIVHNDQSITFRAAVSFVSCDNLGAHWIGGFQESFSAFRFCRICMLTSEKRGSTFNENQVTLRSVRGYNHHVEMVAEDPSLSTVYGVKCESPLNQLEHFHVVEGLPFDVAHDLFEGVIHYVLDDIISALVSNGYITFSELNTMVENFNYEGTDKVNKPQPMNETQSTFSVKQTAAQTWCLLRLLPLMVGSKIPKESEIWLVLLSMIDVVDLACSPVQTENSASYLGVLVETFLRMYKTVFSEGSIKPKFHFLIHYPTIIRKFGPIIHLWTLRFEAKHSYFKELIHQSKNIKNICFTLAKRHQLFQCYHYTSLFNFLQSDEVRESKGTLVKFSTLEEELKCKIRCLVHNEDSVYLVGSVRVNGVQYQTGLFVVLSVREHDLFFARISQIYIINGVAWFWCDQFDTCIYYRHTNSYQLGNITSSILVGTEDLWDYYPLPGYEISDDSVHIVLKHRLKGEPIF